MVLSRCQPHRFAQSRTPSSIVTIFGGTRFPVSFAVSTSCTSTGITTTVFNVVYVEMSGGEDAGVRGRLKKHLRNKSNFMSHRFTDIVFTASVRSAQQRFDSREHNERFSERAGPNEALTEQEVGFISARDSFYMATVNEDGWPYVQHRGGPPGLPEGDRTRSNESLASISSLSIGIVRNTLHADSQSQGLAKLLQPGRGNGYE